MLKLGQFANIDVEVQNALTSVADNLKAAEWNRGTNNVKSFKNAIKTQGLVLQNSRCAWCTLMIDKRGHRTAHRDHIAPKAIYPQWTFHPKNLVLACEYCNGFTVKCDLDTIQNLDEDYDKCEFYIVHPYLDEVDQHIEFLETDQGKGITIRGVSPKGIWTVYELKLDDPHLTVLRAQEYLYAQFFETLPDDFASLFRQATGRADQGDEDD